MLSATHRQPQLITSADLAQGPDFSACKKCGRPLSNPDSRRAGFGPICRGRNCSGGGRSADDTLPPADEQFRVNYEGYWCEGAFATIRVYRRNGVTLVVATDESDSHQNTSVTNRVERVMYLAWEQLGRPDNIIFAEHYRGRGKGVFAEELDFVDFARTSADYRDRHGPYVLATCRMSGIDVGPEFDEPQWMPAKAAFERFGPDLKSLVGGE